MEDDNIIPYEVSPSLTAKQAVMYMLGYRGEYIYTADTDEIEFDLSDYLLNLQEEADCAYGNASYELEILKKNDIATSEEMTSAQQRVESTKADLEKARNLPSVAEKYRLLINHEISRARLGKRTPLVIDEDESADTGKLRINTASFLEWLEGMELDDANETPAPNKLPLAEEALDKEMDLSRKSAESLYLTLGLIVSLFAESSGSKFGSGQKPTVIRIAKEIAKYAKQQNGDYPLRGQSPERIMDRIEVALSTLQSNILNTPLTK